MSMDEKEFAERGPRSVRLAWGLVAAVVVIFLLAIWKVRPF